MFLNGHRLEGVCRGNIPLRADVTNLLKLDGENELIVLERGDIALAREDYVDRYTPDAWIENDAHRDYPPTDGNLACGLGLYGCGPCRRFACGRRWLCPTLIAAK